MKLRIQGSSIRIRLSEDEVHVLAETGRVEDQLIFDPEESFTYAVEVHDDEEIAVLRGPGQIAVLLPKSDVEDWPYDDVVGFEAVADNGAEGLTILVEKDLPCEH
jgi:hypothetical protein